MAKKNMYGCVYLAERRVGANQETRVNTSQCLAVSKEEAVGLTFAEGLKDYPNTQGWKTAGCAAFEISQELIEQWQNQ